MTAQQLDERQRGSGAAGGRWANVLAVACVLAVFALYGPMSGRLTGRGTLLATAFYLAYGLTVLACVVFAIRPRPLLTTAGKVVRRRPIRVVILVLNVAVCGIGIVFIAKHWGLLAFMLVASTAALWLLLVPEPKQFAAVDRTVAFSPATFFVVYLMLGAGEAYLRFHPMRVGGGGGGNPALRQLYAGLYSTNSFGLRGDALSLERPEGTFRILSVGDSFTYGQGVPFEDVYTEQLERRLNDTSGGPEYEVINAGKSGVNTAWELAYLKRPGLRFEPNLITVQFYLNDVTIDRRTGTGRGTFDALMAPLRRSYVLFFLRYRFGALQQSRNRTDWRENVARRVTREQPAWKACAAAIDGLGTISREAEILILVALFPHPGEAHPATGVVHRAVAERRRRAGLHVLDLADALRQVPPADQIVSAIDHHPSAKLHHIAAGEILDAVRAEGLVPPAHSPPRRRPAGWRFSHLRSTPPRPSSAP